MPIYKVEVKSVEHVYVEVPEGASIEDIESVADCDAFIDKNGKSYALRFKEVWDGACRVDYDLTVSEENEDDVHCTFIDARLIDGEWYVRNERVNP